MAFSKMISPKKKRKARIITDSPFPVPIATQQHQNEWFYYTGYLHDNHVEVKHSGDIDRLYKMGFFGKGTLSRSKPEFNQNYRWIDIPNSKGEIIHARVMSRRSYVHRLNWQLTKDCNTEQHTEYDSAEELWQKREECETLNKDGQNTHFKEPERKDNISTDILSGINTENLNQQWSQSAYNWETSVEGSNEELWEEDADFWDTESCDKSKEEKGSKRDIWQESDDIWTSDEQKKSSFISKLQIESEFDKTDTISLQQTDDSNIKLKEDCSDNIVSSEKGEVVFEKCSVTSKNDEFEKCSGRETQNNININSLQENPTSIPEHTPIDGSNSDPRVGSEGHIQNVAELFENNAESDLDSLCKSDDEDGELFVVEDSDSDVEQSKRRKVTKKKWRPVLKRDPFHVQENLHLSFEEAFFLSYGLGCLVVKDENERTPDLTEMLKIFSRRQKTFLPNYIAYHYYRSKGWVPKTGLKFGTDFYFDGVSFNVKFSRSEHANGFNAAFNVPGRVIYKEGPAFYHGSYSVIVKMVTEETMIEDPCYQTREFTWTSLAGLNRLTEQVAKEVLICYIIKPNNMTSEDLLSPKCIPLFHVKEILLTRWVSSQEREKKSDDIP